MFNDHFNIVSEAKRKTIYGEELRMLTPKQMLQRLLIAIAQVKAGSTSKNLLNEMYSLYRAKGIPKKVYNNK